MRCLVLICLLLAPLTALAEDMAFDVRLRGVTAAQVEVTARLDGAGYALAARLRTTGLVGALSRRAYGVESTGRRDGRVMRPARAVLDDRSGREQGRRVLTWSGGRPRVVEADPPLVAQPWSVDAPPAGAVDPLSAFWSLLQAGGADMLCNTSLTTFDGVRLGQIAVARATTEGGSLTCAAQFERIGGYSPDELAERRVFPFTLVFVPVGGDTYRLSEIRARTPIGQAVLRRR